MRSIPNSWLPKTKYFENSDNPQAKLEIIRNNSWYKNMSSTVYIHAIHGIKSCHSWYKIITSTVYIHVIHGINSCPPRYKLKISLIFLQIPMIFLQIPLRFSKISMVF
jgi:hypothetical protein